MTRDVVNLVDMTRLEAGGVQLRREPTDIGETMGAALRRTATLAREHRMELCVDRDLPFLNLDAVLLEQAVVNLIDNAVKYAPRGSTVTLSARAEPARLLIQVADEGPGLAPETLERAFDLFYRGPVPARQA